MSRPTDTERGARLALDISLGNLHPDLFPDLMQPGEQELWDSIFVAAGEQLEECLALREAQQ